MWEWKRHVRAPALGARQRHPAAGGRRELGSPPLWPAPTAAQAGVPLVPRPGHERGADQARRGGQGGQRRGVRRSSRAALASGVPSQRRPPLLAPPAAASFSPPCLPSRLDPPLLLLFRCHPDDPAAVSRCCSCPSYPLYSRSSAVHLLPPPPPAAAGGRLHSLAARAAFGELRALCKARPGPNWRAQLPVCTCSRLCWAATDRGLSRPVVARRSQFLALAAPRRCMIFVGPAAARTETSADSIGIPPAMSAAQTGAAPPPPQQQCVRQLGGGRRCPSATAGRVAAFPRSPAPLTRCTLPPIAQGGRGAHAVAQQALQRRAARRTSGAPRRRSCRRRRRNPPRAPLAFWWAPPPRPHTCRLPRCRAQAQIRGLAESCGAVPDICKRRAPGEPDPATGAQVPS